MIKLLEIQRSICERIRQEFGDNMLIYLGNVPQGEKMDKKHSKEPFFYIDMRISQKFVDSEWVDKSILVDISYIPPLTDYMVANKYDIYNSMDKLEKAFKKALKVNNRFITINNSETYQIVDIVHHSFKLIFSDGEPLDTIENVMEVLTVDFKKER